MLDRLSVEDIAAELDAGMAAVAVQGGGYWTTIYEQAHRVRALIKDVSRGQ